MPKKARTTQRKRRFLQAIERGASVTVAADYAGVDRTTPYKWEQTDPRFADAWETIRDLALAELTDLAMDMARAGSQRMTIFLINKFERQQERRRNQAQEVVIVERSQDDDSDFISFDPG